MTTISLQDAQQGLADLVHRLAPGDEVVITENDQPVARLTAAEASQTKRRQPGTLRGTVLYMAPDFDPPPDDFREFTE
jgi:antitoxin (DNA-binding transcriptional repressor) of toxin-antitoxin stability system